jgi:hypothetical protein
VDKFDVLVEAIVAGADPAQQTEARAIMSVLADLARDFEQFCADVDRIATAAEKIAEKLG